MRHSAKFRNRRRIDMSRKRRHTLTERLDVFPFSPFFLCQHKRVRQVFLLFTWSKIFSVGKTKFQISSTSPGWASRGGWSTIILGSLCRTISKTLVRKCEMFKVARRPLENNSLFRENVLIANLLIITRVVVRRSISHEHEKNLDRENPLSSS